jgi:O-antigen/teichoic acid export membrane protein
MATLTTGNAIAQLFPILVAPVLTRLYEPQAFAVYGLFLAIAGPIAAGASLAYDKAITIPGSDREAAELLWVAVIAAAATGLVTLVLVAAGQSYIARLADNPLLPTALIGAPVFVLAVAVTQALGTWLVRRGEFGRSASSRVIHAAGNAATSVFLGLAATALGLVAGTLVGACLALAWAVGLAVRDPYLWPPAGLAEVKRAARRYLALARYGTGPAVMSAASYGIPMIVCSTIVDAATTGQFALARSILALPLGVAGAALSQSLLSDLSVRASRQQPVLPTVRKTALTLAAIAVPGVGILVWIGEELFAWAFGDRWRPAGAIAEILALPIGLMFVFSPLSAALLATRSIRTNAAWQVMNFLARIFLFVLPLESLTVFLWTLVAIESGAYLFCGALTLQRSWRHDLRLRRGASVPASGAGG